LPYKIEVHPKQKGCKLADLSISKEYLQKTLIELLNIASPSGFTDRIAAFVCKTLQECGINFHTTQRGAIISTLSGRQNVFDRSIVAHLDTLGAMVKTLKDNGRLTISPVGTWSSRYAEGARVTIYSDSGPVRGTVLPLLASGHIHGDKVDSQPTSWEHVEVRIDQVCKSAKDLNRIGIEVGDYVAIDSATEITSTGFINARHLDDKAGVAILLAVAQWYSENEIELPVDCHLVFTITEEVGSGASAVIDGDTAEMVALDHAPVGPGQNAIEDGVTIAMMDLSGPYDIHLSRKLVDLCKVHGITYTKDIFKHYRSDSSSAISAGNDTRTALIGFGVDASHGYERSHISSLLSVAELLGWFIQSPPAFKNEIDALCTLK
jgi:peptidase M42 family hydrolase